MRMSVGLSSCVVLLGLLQACASVPMASAEQDAKSKTFAAPPANETSLYVFRNSAWELAGAREIRLDGVLLGAMADEVYLHRQIAPGTHTMAAESEFGEISIAFKAEAGKLCFVRLYFDWGLFVCTSRLAQVSEEEGKDWVLNSHEALGEPVKAAP